MSQGPRVRRPERDQLRWDTVHLDSQLPPEHQARLVWSYDRAWSCAHLRAASEPATMPRAVRRVIRRCCWRWAVCDVGRDRRCAGDRASREDHLAHRWLCGGVPANHDPPSSFRRESGAVLDVSLTQSLTGLIAEGLVTVEEVIIDGTKTQARAGRGSLAQDERLTRIEARVAEHVARLRRELAADPAGAERRRQERALRAAEEQEVRLRRARAKLGTGSGEARAGEVACQSRGGEERARGVDVGSGGTLDERWRTTPHGWRGTFRLATAQGFVVTIEPPIGAMTAVWHRSLWRRSNAAAGRRPSGCWPTPWQ